MIPKIPLLSVTVPHETHFVGLTITRDRSCELPLIHCLRSFATTGLAVSRPLYTAGSSGWGYGGCCECRTSFSGQSSFVCAFSAGSERS